MNIFLAIQSTYHDVQFALYSETNELGKRCIDKKSSSKLLIPEIKRLMLAKNVSVSDLQLIVVNQGPAPFTTLRVVLASMNGLSFARDVPLIGVDAFDLMLHEWHDATLPITTVLLNAFGRDIYFAIRQKDQPLITGVQPIDLFLEQCADFKRPIQFIGNGTLLYKDLIQNRLKDQAVFPPTIPEYSSLGMVAIRGYEMWNKGEQGVGQLLPRYQKKDPY